MNSQELEDILEICEKKDVSINVISKSGTTTEPAVAFRIFKKFLEDKYGKEEAKNSPAAAATLRYPIFCFIFFLLVEIIPPRRAAAVLMQ